MKNVHRGAGQADGGAGRRHRQRRRRLAEVEDLYRPYKQKRRTRATVAREKGLEPLAELLFAQERDCPGRRKPPRTIIDPEKGVETAADALQGANDIIAEWISDDAAVRKSLRELLERQGTSAFPRRHGGGQRLPPVLRFRAVPQPACRATRFWPSTGARRRKC